MPHYSNIISTTSRSVLSGLDRFLSAKPAVENLMLFSMKDYAMSSSESLSEAFK